MRLAFAVVLAVVLAAGCAAGCAALPVLPSSSPPGPGAVRRHLAAVVTAGDRSVSAAGGADPSPAGATRTLPLVPLPSRRALSAGQRGEPVRGVEPRATRPFSLLGVTWRDPSADLRGTVRLRTRSRTTGRWSGWRTLAAGSEDTPDAGSRDRTGPRARGGTDPLWVGPSDGVQVRVVPARRGGRPAVLPAGLRVDLVDPGPDPVGPVARRALPPEGRPAGVQRAFGTAPRPAIVPRATWEGSGQDGADPEASTGAVRSARAPGRAHGGPRSSGTRYSATVKVLFVHHTATSGEYDCDEAPAIIRSIYRYHVESNGWSDIGYNFLIDRCGTIYEGRAGGVGRAVVGAHTLGFNRETTGVAAIGDFSTAVPPDALLEALSRLAAWKLGRYGRDPLGQETLVTGDTGSRFEKGEPVVFPVIAGHRDAVVTECPGDGLYDELPAVRAEAARLQGR